MEGEQQPVYEQYPQYKNVNGISVRTPIEIREDILNEIANYVTSTLQINKVGTSFCKLLRQTLDRKFGPCWHVFVGKNFGCYAVHDKNSFVNFKYQGYTYLVYKTTV